MTVNRLKAWPKPILKADGTPKRDPKAEKAPKAKADK
jgi:hypothetical protein